MVQMLRLCIALGMMLIQIDRVMKDRVGEQQHRRIDGGGVEHAIEDGPDQQRDHAVRRAHASHQEDGEKKVDPVAFGEGQQAQQISHACTRMRSSASSTCCSVTDWMPAGFRITTEGVRQGCQMAGSDEPKIATDGHAEGRGHVGGSGIVAEEERQRRRAGI